MHVYAWCDEGGIQRCALKNSAEGGNPQKSHSGGCEDEMNLRNPRSFSCTCLPQHSQTHKDSGLTHPVHTAETTGTQSNFHTSAHQLWCGLCVCSSQKTQCLLNKALTPADTLHTLTCSNASTCMPPATHTNTELQQPLSHRQTAITHRLHHARQTKPNTPEFDLNNTGQPKQQIHTSLLT